jgi:hypothetical protein
MSAYEPRDVGPAVGGDRPVSAADRSLVQNVLDAAAREGRLAPAEYQRRSSIAAGAVTFDDLIPLTRDLSASGFLAAQPTAAQAVQPYAATAAYPVPAEGERATLVGVFSGFDRKGTWTAPPAITSVTVFGGGDIDLRQAVWTTPTIEVTVTAMFGGLDIKVPPGTEVVNQAIGIFGGVGVKVEPGPPNGRRLVLKGFCAFGGVGVKSR